MIWSPGHAGADSIVVKFELLHESAVRISSCDIIQNDAVCYNSLSWFPRALARIVPSCLINSGTDFLHLTLQVL